MKARAKNPFKAQPDWQYNACIDNYMQFERLAGCYLRSADALVACAIEDTSTLDVHVYAIWFLYRHSIELMLKDLIWKSDYAVFGNKQFNFNEMAHHRLQDLWRDVELRTHKLLGEDFPSKQEQESQMQELFKELQKHDPDSYSMRYPFDKKKKRTHLSLTHVKIHTLRKRAHQTIDFLYLLLEMVNFHCDERSEYERQQR